MSLRRKADQIIRERRLTECGIRVHDRNGSIRIDPDGVDRRSASRRAIHQYAQFQQQRRTGIQEIEDMRETRRFNGNAPGDAGNCIATQGLAMGVPVSEEVNPACAVRNCARPAGVAKPFGEGSAPVFW